MSARTLVTNFRSGALSPVEALASVMRRAEETNDHIAAFYWRDDERALKAAAASEQRWLRGEALSAIDGLPISVKDNLEVAGAPSYLGSPAHVFKPPATASNAIVQAFADQGAVVFAKTTMVETGYFQASISALYGPARNPWNLDMTTGGSTSGGAAAAAAFAGPVHLGTDGGGSLRTPASSCGCVALKATAHRLPFGLVKGSAANDTQARGFITRDACDQAWVFQAIAGAAGRQERRALKELRLAYLEEPLADPSVGPVHPEVRRVVEAAVGRISREAPVEVVRAPIFHGPIAGAAGLGAFVALAEKYRDAPRSLRDRMHPIVSENIALVMGQAQRAAALRARQRIWLDEGADRLDRLFEAHDVLLLPTLFHPSFEAERGWHPDSPLIEGMNYAWSCGASPHLSWVRQGPPSIALPCGLDSNGCPVGLMAVGAPGSDLLLLEVAQALQVCLEGWDVSAAPARDGNRE